LRIDPRLIGFTATGSRFVSEAQTLHASTRRPSMLFASSSAVPSARLLQSSFAPTPSLGRLRPSFTCLGFVPSSRHHPRASTFHEELPGPRYGPASSFLDSSPVFSARELASLFHLAATSRVLPVQGFLSSRSHPSSSEGACPLAFATSALTALRRLPRDRSSASRPSSTRSSVPLEKLCTSPTAAPLFRFLSSRFSFSPSDPAYLDHPLVVLPLRAFARALASLGHLQRMLNKNFDDSVSVTTDLLEFLSLPSRTLRFPVNSR